MNLRDETRVAEQKKSTLTPPEFELVASGLEEVQTGLRDRTQAVIDQLQDLEVAKNKNYGKALKRLDVAKSAMRDASELFATAETGPPTIAAETEAIEALLITKRGGGGGGGGGESPGGGTGGGTADENASALAGLGDGLEFEQRFVSQSVGNERSDIPEEFRAGLDAYFGAVDGRTN